MSGLKRNIMGNPFCDFCATLKFERMMLNERCAKMNYKAHVKTNTPYSGVIINNYIVDQRKRIYEKNTKTFSKLRFCPVCGFDYVENRQYDGKFYINTDFNVLLQKMEEGHRKKD